MFVCSLKLLSLAAVKLPRSRFCIAEAIASVLLTTLSGYELLKETCKATALTGSASFPSCRLRERSSEALGEKADSWLCGEELKKALRNWRSSGGKRQCT